MNSIILNFTNNFNLVDVESIIHGIDSSDLLFFNELAYVTHQDTIDDKYFIRNRLVKLKNLLLQHSLTFDANSNKLRIITILSYDSWSFLGHKGEFNSFPPFKMKYLLSAIKELFPEYQKQMELYFVVLALPSKSFYRLFDNIENECLDEFEEDVVWFLKESFRFNQKKKNITLNSHNESDNICDIHIINKFIIDTQVEYLNEITRVLNHHRLSDLIKIFLDEYDRETKSIITVRDFQLFDFDKLCCSIINNFFSLKSFTTKDCVLFKITMGESLSENIKSKAICASLIHLLCNISVDDNSFNNNPTLYNLTNANLSTDFFNHYFECIQGLYEGASSHKKSIKAEISYYRYELNTAHVSVNPEISVDSYNKIIKESLLVFKIPCFFNYSKIHALINTINLENFAEVEKEILVTKDFVLSKISTESLLKTEKKATYESIKFELDELTRNPVQVISKIDFEGYLKTKTDITKKIEAEKKVLAESLMALTKLKNLLAFSALSIILMTILYWPLFFEYNVERIPFAIGAFLIMIGCSSVIAHLIIKRKIKTSIKCILEHYVQLLKNLDSYYKSIRDTAKELADAIVYKANYQELLKIMSGYNKENLMVDKWKAFLSKLMINNSRIEQVLKIKPNTRETYFAKHNLLSYYCIPRSVFSNISKSNLKIKINNSETILKMHSFLKDICFSTK